MISKTSVVKIVICTAFFSLFACTAVFRSSNESRLFTAKKDSNSSENPQKCAACHQENFDSWHRMSHRKTVRQATSENVKGDFSAGMRLSSKDFHAEMERGDDGAFYIKINDDSYKIEAIVGENFIEQYVGAKDGEFYSLPVGYDLTKKRWTHLNDTDFAGKDASLSRHLQNWKTDCASCHRPDEKDEKAAPETFTDFGVSCNSCHTEASDHAAARDSLWAKLGFAVETKTTAAPKQNSDAAMLTSCAVCHSRDLAEKPQAVKFSGVEKPLELIAAHRQNASDSQKYWADGAHKFSGSEFPALVRSVCYVQSKAGGGGLTGEKISCASCHAPHAAAPNPDVPGQFETSAQSVNQNCLKCHAEFADQNLAAQHTKHPADSAKAVSSCVSCHQPETVYGRLRFVPTHEISVPNPALTAAIETPNACNLCHSDRSVNWAIDASKKLWPERFRSAKVSADRQFDRPEGLRLLASHDPFLRALAADSMRKHSKINWASVYLRQAEQNEQSELVRYFLENAIGDRHGDSPE